MHFTGKQSAEGDAIGWRMRLLVTVATLLAVALSIPVGYVVVDIVGAAVG